MKAVPLVPVLALTLLVGLLPRGLAGQRFSFSDANWRPTSGERGPDVRTAEAQSGHGIKTVAIYEALNVPREIFLERERLCAGSCPDGSHATLRTEDNDAVSFAISDRTRVTVGENRFITAIQVCTTGQSDSRRRRIKGLRVWSARITASGQVDRTQQMVEDRQSNCAIWHEKQMCIGNRVAVGLRAYYDRWTRGTTGLTGQSSPFFTGIDIQCARVG